jgi:RimJ/RimL family protein N-acetyltransferase
MRIREARSSDVEAIIGYTTGTFSWGDYVPAMISGWIEDGEGTVLVAVDKHDVSIAMARSVFLSDTEVWSHAARVHPDHRGQGIAGELAEELMARAKDHGGQVVRLLIEDDNVASIQHIKKIGFRKSASATRATRSVGAAAPNPEGNGGRGRPSRLRSRLAKTRDAPLVMASWSTSDTGRALRQLVGTGWQFHRLRLSDITDAAKESHLWEVGSSWAITGATEPTFEVRMLDTRSDEAYDVIRALVDTANNQGAETFTGWLADVDWLAQAARRAGCEVTSHGIWEHPL